MSDENFNGFFLLFSSTGPKEFTGPDDALAFFCNSVPMPCKFPFIHNGVQRNECINDTILTDTTESTENFFWCATHTDEDHNMVWWGQCDLSECEIGNLLLVYLSN